jgi:Tfp pilus assembly protein PilO
MHIIDEDTRRFGRLLHYAGVLATVICTTAGYSFLHAPAVHEIAETSARIDELLESVRNGPITRQHYRIAEDKLRSVTTRISDLKRRVPSEADAGAFLKEITRLAEGDQLAIKDFDPEKPEMKPGYGEMQVTLKGQGSFGSLCTFLEQLTRLTRLSKITDLTLSAGDNPAEYPMTATLVIYFGLRGTADASAPEGHRG